MNQSVHWSRELGEEVEANRMSGCVGSVLVSETALLRIWHLRLAAGERCRFHRHVLPYFWTCHSNGEARNYAEDGTTTDVTYRAGDTRHLDYGPGEYLLHSLENIGTTELVFTTVEFKDGPNEPLPVPDIVRLQSPVAA